MSANLVQYRGVIPPMPSFAFLSAGALFRYPSGEAIYMKLGHNSAIFRVERKPNEGYAVHLGTGAVYAVPLDKVITPIPSGGEVVISVMGGDD